MKHSIIALALLATASPVAAQLRVVTYNTLLGPNTGMATVLEAIGDEVVNGFATPIDILLLQEQDEPFTTTQAILNQLNGIYGPGAYARGSLVTGPSFSSLRQGVIYNTRSVELLEEDDIGVAGGAPLQPREALRSKFRPVGYDERSDFYVYNSHFKAGSNDSDFDRRAVEARALRNDADALGEGAHVIFAGDLNLRSSFDEAFQELIASGPAQAFDPADFPGQWKNNFNARSVHTHGTSEVDDRFDFQLPSLEWRDGEGLDLIDGSYRAFGNNGSTYNRAVNDTLVNTYPLQLIEGSGVTRVAALNALRTASDHLPVVADYQLPAILDAALADTDGLFSVGETASLSLTVENVANVIDPLGADELDYTVSWSGADSGSLIDFDLADGVANEHAIPLDTSTPGSRSTAVTIRSDSAGVMNGLLEFIINYEVLSNGLAGDFNEDGRVDAADYTVWRDGAGLTYNQQDYLDWQANFGAESSDAASIPEPTSGLLCLLGALAISASRARGNAASLSA